MENRVHKTLFSKPVFLYHALYWVFNVLLFTLIFWSASDNRDFLLSLHENTAYLPFGMLFTYATVNILVPRYFLKSRVFTFLFLQVALLLLYPVFSNLVRAFYIQPVILGEIPDYHPFESTLYTILILIFDIVPLAGVKILHHLKKDEAIRQKAENQKTEAELKLREAELKLLKSQIQPHFLFNTLNNLYALSLEKSDKTPDLIIKLADMLSYIIYDCNAEKVPLSKELEFLSSFIELQRVRYDNCRISFKSEGDTSGSQIAPMILHTFIDNAFKHGADKDSGRPWIHVAIRIKNGYLDFESTNSIRQGAGINGSSPGIGISNVIRRLQLIYPNHHILDITNSDERYSVSLKLQL
ncbi:MAG: sensor histidine kinase [Bacteroidales bacterium]|nr:sensor histidine kinase [Bacteroidales bacterium]